MLLCVFEHHVVQFFKVNDSGAQIVHEMRFEERVKIKSPRNRGVISSGRSRFKPIVMDDEIEERDEQSLEDTISNSSFLKKRLPLSRNNNLLLKSQSSMQSTLKSPKSRN